MSGKALVLIMCTMLLFSNALAQTEDVRTNKSEYGEQYNGRTYTFYNLDTSPPTTVNVNLLQSTVSGNGLKFSAPSTQLSGGTVNLNVSGTTVSDATISFEGVFIAKSSLTVEYTEATMQSSKPVFSISNLNLKDGATLTILNVRGSYNSASNAGYVVDSSATGNEPFTIIDNSGLFLINVNFNNAAGIFEVQPTNAALISINSALTIDYSKCNSCSQAIVSFPDNINVTENSLLRINKDSITGNDTHILKTNANLLIANGSLLEINNCTSEGPAFSFRTGSFSANNSQVVFSNITASSSGINASLALPVKIYPQSTFIYAGGCNFSGVQPKSVSEYKRNGINADKVLGANGRSTDSSNQCLFATCVPGNNNPSAASGVCECNCESNSFAPSCTGSSDPVTIYEANSDNGSCPAFHCQICDPFNESKCVTCLPGYVNNTDSQCVLPVCRIRNCKRCFFRSSPLQCQQCRRGYHFNFWRICVRNQRFDGASYIHAAPLAFSALFIVAAAVTTIV